MCAWLLPLSRVRGVSILSTRGRRRHDAAIQVGALGNFELARDKDDAAVCENDADSWEEDVDEGGKGGYNVCFASSSHAGGDAEANEERDGDNGEEDN